MFYYVLSNILVLFGMSSDTILKFFALLSIITPFKKLWNIFYLSLPATHNECIHCAELLFVHAVS